MERRKSGGQPGNKNAKKPSELKRSQIHPSILPKHQKMLEEIERAMSSKTSIIIGWAIEFLYAKIKKKGKDK